MCKKLIYLIPFVLVLGSVSNAEDIQWTDLGADHLWSTPENWDLGRVPTLADDVRIDVPAAGAPNGPVIQDGIDAKANGIFTEAPGEPTLTMTGGTLEVAEWIWWGDGADSFGIWEMSGGTISVVNEFELGWGGGAGTLIMTGGTINAGEAVIPTGSGAFGELLLQGGTYNVTKPGELKVNATGLIDVTEGTLVLAGDERTKINDLIAAGLITAYSGSGKFELDYNTRSGKTTVTAIPGPKPVNPGKDGLVAYFAFENDVNDSSGNENHGTVFGDPIYVEGPASYGMAMEFDGDGDYVDCGNDPSLSITDAVTVSAWIKVAVQGADHKVGGNQDGANGGYKMSVYNDKIEFEIRTASNSSVLNRSVGGGTVIEVGVWYHVVGVYSLADGYIRTYVNGVLDRELLTTQALGASPGSFMIGCEPFSTGEYNFNGVMDEIRIYNKALSEGEVLYLSGKRATPVDPGTEGLVAHYAFENDANDSSGNELHGTLVGDAKFAEGPAGYGMALDLDGDGDYVDCGAPPQFDITEQIAITYWIKVVAFDKGWNTVLSRGDSSWRSSRAGENNFMEAAVSGTTGDWTYGVTPVDDEQWHHVGWVYDGTMNYMYVDGELDASEESTGLINVTTYPLFIGNNSQNTDREWTGLIDEVAIYNRALSEGEVMYLAGKRATPVITVNPIETMEATGDFGDILSINGIPVSDLIVGTTMFPDPPASEPQPAENADNFSLATAATADNQPYMQTMFGQAVTTIFIFEKSGNDNGSMQALDAMGDPVGNAVVFSPADFASTGYTGYGDQVAFGTVITSEYLSMALF
ncbi:MAG: LamG domain-containing protein [Sedimentisphaerales bacterium]